MKENQKLIKGNSVILFYSQSSEKQFLTKFSKKFKFLLKKRFIALDLLRFMHKIAKFGSKLVWQVLTGTVQVLTVYLN